VTGRDAGYPSEKSEACIFVLIPFHGAVTRTTNLAVKILRDTMIAGKQVTDDDTAVRLALRVLWPHCPEKWPLTQFWEGAQGSHDIGRSQSMTASFNGIVRQLRRSGAWSDASPS
jgi:hypothetical protein